MGINKKIIIATVLLIVEVVSIFFVMSFMQNHSISIKYDDDKILGRTPQEIVDEYGLFDIAYTRGMTVDGDIEQAGYYLRPAIDSNDDYYYFIYFNEDGIAYRLNTYDTNYYVSESLTQWTKKGSK